MGVKRNVDFGLPKMRNAFTFEFQHLIFEF